MKAAILGRAGSMSPRTEITGRSPSVVPDGSASFHGHSRSMKFSLDVKEKRDLPSPAGAPSPLRRVRSDTDIFQFHPFRSRWSPSGRLEEENGETYVALSSAPAVAEETEELDYPGGGTGNGSRIGGGKGREGKGDANQGGDRRIVNYYYQNMLKADPSNPLLLRNYARFLHEVEGDLEGAEEYYGRAILESPDDGDLLSLYGRLVWESKKDCKRAEGFYKRAVKASPDDCYVLGSYANFLWDAEEENEEEQQLRSGGGNLGGGPTNLSSQVPRFNLEY